MEDDDQQEETSAGDSEEDEFERFGRIRAPVRGRKRRRVLSELEKYLEPGVVDTKVKDPLNWWLTKGSRYPILQRMALDLYSIPAMSSECERVFSQTKLILTDQRNRFGNDMLEAVECQRHWLKSGILDETVDEAFSQERLIR